MNILEGDTGQHGTQRVSLHGQHNVIDIFLPVGESAAHRYGSGGVAGIAQGRLGTAIADNQLAGPHAIRMAMIMQGLTVDGKDGRKRRTFAGLPIGKAFNRADHFAFESPG